MPEQALRMKDGRKLRANDPDADERLQRRRQTRRLLGDKRIPFSFYCLDLLQHQLETIEFSGDLRLNVRGGCTAVARAQPFQTRSPITAQRR